QPIIDAFPVTIFVILHSSYSCRETLTTLDYLTSNIDLDFGENFPFISTNGYRLADGQRTVMRHVLELVPTNKILRSSS
ncbi:hypothetical protein DFH29DRAFT_789867, partial [Suillus ampliporus]